MTWMEKWPQNPRGKEQPRQSQKSKNRKHYYNNRVILKLNVTFGEELAVLHKFSVYAWRYSGGFEQRTLYIRSLRSNSFGHAKRS